MLAKLSELLKHRLSSPKCVVAGKSVCSDMFVIKQIVKRKLMVEKIELELFTSGI